MLMVEREIQMAIRKQSLRDLGPFRRKTLLSSELGESDLQFNENISVEDVRGLVDDGYDSRRRAELMDEDSVAMRRAEGLDEDALIEEEQEAAFLGEGEEFDDYEQDYEDDGDLDKY